MSETALNISYILIQIAFGFLPGLFLNMIQESRFKHSVVNVLIMALLWDIPFALSYVLGTKQPFGMISLLLIFIVAVLIYKSSLFDRIFGIVLYFIILVPMEILAYSILQINMDINSKEFAVASAALSFSLPALFCSRSEAS